ncbi:MAG: glycosyltransferase [Chitinophagaceae bacterium]|nr:glycosyltransferase [Chitinophagaceae bacterium]MCZ2396333.1 glycosyltransferase [Chitinophagales bacterium]
MMDTYLKVGYVPYSPDLSQPGDRRRFPYFAARCHLPFEIADPSKNYDLILLTGSANLSLWLEYKRKNPSTKFIFEMVDSLIFDPNLFFKWFKGTGRYVIGKEKKWQLNYSKLIFEWIRIADLVLCSNEVLKNNVEQINQKALLSPDYLESEYSLRKNNFELRDSKMNIVWEGLSSVLSFFFVYQDLLKEISPFCRLHVISNEKYPVVPGIYYKNVSSRLSRLPIETIFYHWDLKTHNEILMKGDCAIIPINPKIAFSWNKPANKLVSFWFSGLPTITSDTPAYKKLMDAAGLNCYAHNQREWMDKLRNLYKMNPAERAAIAETGYQYAKKHFSDEQLDKIWMVAFNAVR